MKTGRMGVSLFPRVRRRALEIKPLGLTMLRMVRNTKGLHVNVCMERVMESLPCNGRTTHNGSYKLFCSSGTIRPYPWQHPHLQYEF